MIDLAKMRADIEHHGRNQYIHFARLCLTPDQAIELIDRVEAAEGGEPDRSGELTALEHKVLASLAALGEWIHMVIGNGPSAASDWNEAAHHIHALQRMIGSQAAARAYPALYRPLGAGVPGGQPETIHD